jgi:hypothetical protein
MDQRICEVCKEVIPYNPKKGLKNYEMRTYCSKACAKDGSPRRQPKLYPERLKPCETCGTIIPKESNRNWNMYAKKRYCSKVCSGKAHLQRIQVTCVICGKEFERPPAMIRGKTYCSQKCRQNKRECTCEVCGKVFVKCPSQLIKNNHIYCGRACQGIGKRKHNKQNQGRRSPEDLAWKAQVLNRDNFQCQHCGTDRKLEAHHIKEARDFPELRHELTNGLTLCHQCHYYGVHRGMPNFIHGRYSKPRSQTPALQEPA